MYLNKEPLCGNGKSKFILIKDSSILPGLSIFKTVLKIFLKEKHKVSLMFFEEPFNIMMANMDVDTNEIECLDMFTDPLGWNDSQNNTALVSVGMIGEKFSNFKGVLCIYSLSSLILHNGVTETFKTLHKLLRNNPDLQILSLMHSDVQDLDENETMEKLSTTLLEIKTDDSMLATVHYSSGKVSSSFYQFKISETFEFDALSDMKMQPKKIVTKQPDPTAHLTFNLKLKDDEKEAREQLQLPYMDVQSSHKSVDQTIVIEDDFYDEEDPDDDLDI